MGYGANGGFLDKANEFARGAIGAAGQMQPSSETTTTDEKTAGGALGAAAGGAAAGGSTGGYWGAGIGAFIGAFSYFA